MIPESSDRFDLHYYALFMPLGDMQNMRVSPKYNFER